MSELLITIDPCNPGQFYACCGLIELLEFLGAETLSRFEIDEHRPRRAEFLVRGQDELPLDRIILAMGDEGNYEFVQRTTAQRKRRSQKSGDEDESLPDKAAPISFVLENKFLVLDWWLDPYHAQAKEFTLLWPGRATSQTIAAKLLAGMKEFSESPTDLINSAAYLESRFGIDTRSSWNALDVGFSPHAQDLPVRTYPFAEMLAAFGLQGFRPRELPNRTYEYVLWRQLLPSIVARTASAYSWSGLDSQTHRFQLVERTGRTVQPTLSQVVAQTRRT